MKYKYLDRIMERSDKIKERAGEMIQGLRALVDLPDILSSIPSNHILDHSSLE